jgi:2-dehydro-3-deoxyphosphooctonate aldolase (KDO 8-P synthase)
VNIKKGQFLAPSDIVSSVDKVRAGGCQKVLVTERGSSFGYNHLIADMTAIPLMQDLGCVVVFDAGHVVRRYGIPSSDPRGGAPRFIPTLCRAGVAAGADALFLETHPSPRDALCDAASQLPLDELGRVLESVLPIAQAVRASAEERP